MNLKNGNGITLIALVITIIVLLILAGVSISAVMGENGIATKAQESAEATKEASTNEEANLIFAEYNLEIIDNPDLKPEDMSDELTLVYSAEDGDGEYDVFRYEDQVFKVYYGPDGVASVTNADEKFLSYEEYER